MEHKKYDYNIVVSKMELRKNIQFMIDFFKEKKVEYALYHKEGEDLPYYVCRKVDEGDIKLSAERHKPIPNLKERIQKDTKNHAGPWEDGEIVEHSEIVEGKYIVWEGDRKISTVTLD